ncbi:hypothetical protein PGT21_004958 [Puccinia graminis f. sp. tritici]|uniref:RING-type domain-containing protein n=1 Tax=Puccinia graminis f. sp. tritici TaxID=56615 RepID=A0A5B0Q214_PUCGR|nr:hypothetical protein PGT21_004958 [Puccinia graminis f. sp. tritici]KAA1137268.1 hypothetical protein PGTUg99_015377 [Puccinia graminis f. sp. tritici]
MPYSVLLFLFVGICFGFDGPQEPIRPTLGHLSERARGGDEIPPAFHSISVEPFSSTGTPHTLSHSGNFDHSPTCVRGSNGSDRDIELQSRANKLPEVTDQRARTSLGSPSTHVIDDESPSMWEACGICFEDFDEAALNHLKQQIPDQPPLGVQQFPDQPALEERQFPDQPIVQEKHIPDQNTLEIQQLKCSHIFHKECIKKWLSQPGRACPFCRDGLITANSNAHDTVISVGVGVTDHVMLHDMGLCGTILIRGLFVFVVIMMSVLAIMMILSKRTLLLSN